MLALFVICDPSVVVGSSAFRIEPDGFREVLNRLIEIRFLFLHVCQAPAVVSIGGIRFEADRFAEVFDRLLILAGAVVSTPRLYALSALLLHATAREVRERTSIPAGRRLLMVVPRSSLSV